LNPQALIELRAGFDERIAELGQLFSLERTGDEFEAILLPVNPIDPQLELGSDWREMATLEGNRERVPWWNIKYGDVILQTNPFWRTDILSTIPKWKIIRKDDNPANFTIKFWVVKITDKDVQS